MTLELNSELLQALDLRGPRYTSYPTALQFREDFGVQQYASALSHRDAPERPISLYIHIPFCRQLCYYCGCTKIVTRSPAKIADYLEHLHQEIRWVGERLGGNREVRQLHFGGGTPSILGPKQMAALFRSLREHFSFPARSAPETGIEIDPRTVSVATLGMYRELGFNRISLGVQDFDPEVQRAINRVQPREHVLALLAEARTLGFRGINVDLIYGLPHQNRQSFDRTLSDIIEARPGRAAVYSYAHLPQQFRAQQLINNADLPPAHEKLALFVQAQRRLRDAGYRYIGMDHFALPDDELSLALDDGSLQRNFQGYSTCGDCDLIGLGMSAIGSLGSSYVQNAKSASSYAQRIASGTAATIRGLRLSEDDLLRRELIQRLMCRHSLKLEEFSSEHGIEFSDYFADAIPELRRYQDLGLLKFDGAVLEITELGRFFLRPICMLFDAYLPAVAAGRYSRVA